MVHLEWTWHEKRFKRHGIQLEALEPPHVLTSSEWRLKHDSASLLRVRKRGHITRNHFRHKLWQAAVVWSNGVVPEGPVWNLSVMLISNYSEENNSCTKFTVYSGASHHMVNSDIWRSITSMVSDRKVPIVKCNIFPVKYSCSIHLYSCT